MTKRTIWMGTVVLLVLAWASATAQAAVPATTQVEGALFSAGGGPPADGDYGIVFSLYKDAQAANPVWSEGPVNIAVKNGAFSHTLGSSTALSQSVLTQLGAGGHLGMKVGTDPEFTRKPLASVLTAMRASVAENLDCSGCIGAGHVDAALLAPYAKTADLAKVATSGKFSDLEGGPDLSAYAKTASLAKAAFSGAYSDLTGVPDLSVYLKASDLADVAVTGAYADLSGAPSLAKVATTGKYADLDGLPTLAKLDAACGTGLVVKGLKADGTYDCVKAMDPSAFPPDAIDELSNGLIANQFVDSVPGKSGVAIPDNNPIGVSDVIDFPDIGIAQKLDVAVNITNSKINTLTVTLIDPGATEYVLHGKSGSGTVIKTSYPDPTKLASGDLTTWIGKNPKGKWYLKVVDADFLNNANDGQIVSWSINLQTLSSKKIQIKGDQYVTGNSFVTGNTAITGNLTVNGTVSGPGFGSPFPVGSKPFLFARYIDNVQNNWNYVNGGIPAYGSSFGTSNDQLRNWGFNKILYGDKFGNVFESEGLMAYNTSANSSWMAVAAFIKNTTANPINLTIYFRYATNGNYGNHTGLSLNGANNWTTSGHDLGSTSAVITFPANQTSTLIMKSGSYYWTGGYYQYAHKCQVGYYNNTFNLPAGLEWDYDRYNAYIANK